MVTHKKESLRGYQITRKGEDAILELWENKWPWRVGNAKDVHVLVAVFNFPEFENIMKDLHLSNRNYTHRQVVNSLRYLADSGYIVVV